jgi:dipeptidyl aminopeptidase
MSSSKYKPLPQDGAGYGDTLHNERASTHSGPVRSLTYYNEGPFDPPSSEDEDESLLQKEDSRSLEMMERAGYTEPDIKVCLYHSASDQDLVPQLHSTGYAQKRPSSLRYLLISLGTLVAISIVIGLFSAFKYSGTATFRGKLKVTLDHILNGTFLPNAQSLLWVPDGA